MNLKIIFKRFILLDLLLIVLIIASAFELPFYSEESPGPRTRVRRPSEDEAPAPDGPAR